MDSKDSQRIVFLRSRLLEQLCNLPGLGPIHGRISEYFPADEIHGIACH